VQHASPMHTHTHLTSQQARHTASDPAPPPHLRRRRRPPHRRRHHACCAICVAGCVGPPRVGAAAGGPSCCPPAAGCLPAAPAPGARLHAHQVAWHACVCGRGGARAGSLTAASKGGCRPCTHTTCAA
jgi:hypothetical protein